MSPFRPTSTTEQVASHLRQAIMNRQWTVVLPGASKLALDLGVNHKTVEAALRQLDREGLLKNLGAGRGRFIVEQAKGTARPLHFGYLYYDDSDSFRDYASKVTVKLEARGHTVTIAPKTISGLNMSLRHIKPIVQQIPADAWMVVAGPRDLLEWFSQQPKPVFALFGRRENLPIPSIGPDYSTAHSSAVRELVRLGHRRILLLTHRERRLPEPGLPERAFLDEIKNQGLLVSDYNLPDWDETPAGLIKLVDSLFEITPPTAIIADEPGIFLGLQQILSARGVHAPQHVSLICAEKYPLFDWCFPSLSHYHWNFGTVAPRILRWASAVSRGERDVRQTLAPVKFV